MTESSLVRLNVKLKKMRVPFEFIEQHAKGKKVLNVGASGGVHGYLPANKDDWLHERLCRFADELVGVDIDEDTIDHATQHGYEILNENCETMLLNKKFGLIVMSDVIEHVNAPVTAISNLLAHLADDGLLIITTPNATPGNVYIRSLFRKDLNVLADHVTTFYPEHFQVICNRIGCRLESIYLFDHLDHRDGIRRFKSTLFQLMTAISLRFASSMLVVIRK